ncbi:MAG: TetR/AcrR family transcriptional regulator [Solirubrobacteraceae bacterium]
MSVRPRTRMTAAQRRVQLLDTTRALVGEQGFHAVSIDAVARRAGITRPVVYDHFPTLGALLEATLERETERALAQLGAVLPSPASPGDRRELLLAALEGYLEVVRADPLTWRLVLMPPEGAPELLRERIAAGRSAIVASLAEVVRPGLGSGSASPDPELTARMLSTLADEAARLVLTNPQGHPIERLTAHARWLLGELSR